MANRKRFTQLPRNAGASYYEFVLVSIVILLLIGVALTILLSVTADAERTRMNEVIQGIEQSLFTVNAEYRVKNRLWQLQEYNDANPIQFLLQPLPEHYAGELGNRDQKPEPGSWYFNYDRGRLIYRVRNVDALFNEAGGDEIAFKLRFNFADKNENRHFDESEDVAYGLVLEPMASYTWVD